MYSQRDFTRSAPVERLPAFSGLEAFQLSIVPIGIAITEIPEDAAQIACSRDETLSTYVSIPSFSSLINWKIT